MVNRIVKRLSLYYKLSAIRLRAKIFDPQNQLYIFSDPRGGSTWLAELLLKIPRTAILWEPLMPKYIERWQNLNFSFRQYIPKEVHWEEAKQIFDLVNSGRMINEWTTLATTTKRYIQAQQLIIKYCRGNALLPWFCEQYQLKFEPVYLIRHPFSVVSSQLRQGGWNSDFDCYHIPSGPYNEIYLKHEPFLSGLTTKEEALTATWCMTNLIPLTEPTKRWHQMNYEHLILEPAFEMKKLLERWGLEITDLIQNSSRIPSSTTKRNQVQVDPKSQLSVWKRDLSKSQVQKMARVLDYFEIEDYTADSELPIH